MRVKRKSGVRKRLIERKRKRLRKKGIVGRSGRPSLKVQTQRE